MRAPVDMTRLLLVLLFACGASGAEEADTPDAAGPSMPPAACDAPLGQSGPVRLCSVERVGQSPLISPATHAGIGTNMSMPTVIHYQGAYWMYFAAHDGHYIRLAQASSPAGPWTLYAPGSLKDTEVAPFSDTISSPDAFVLPDGRVRMYFSTDSYPGSNQQWSGVAESSDGIEFALASTENIAKYYMRAFEWDGMQYALQKGWSTAPAELGVSSDGIARFDFIKTLGGGSIRHMGVLRDGSTLLVFYSKIGDAPERILLSTIDLSTPPTEWDLSAPIEVLRPERSYEGTAYPVEPSVKGPATDVQQLRDPYVFQESGTTYLYYGVAGESGIAAAEIRYELTSD